MLQYSNTEPKLYVLLKPLLCMLSLEEITIQNLLMNSKSGNF